MEQGYFRDDVPLSYEDQDYLHTACEEAGVPYALALAVIQRETSFRNIVGDDGASEYESVDLAVTVYNRGHNPGYITQYGKEVMGYYEEWRGLVGDD